MKVLVTGTTGLVGSHLCDQLVKEKHQIIALARSEKKFQEFEVRGTLIKGDLATGTNSSTNRWIHELPDDLDVVIHCAGLVHSFDQKMFFDVNYKATEILIEDLSKRYKKLIFVLISSLAAVGPSVEFDGVHEDSEPNPISSYGHSKQLAELVLNNIAPTSWKKFIVRPPMVIGPKDQGVLDIFKMVKLGTILHAGRKSKEKKYSFVCVYDLVKGISEILDVIRHNATLITNNPEILHIAHPRSITYGELLEEIKITMRKKVLLHIYLPIWGLRIFAALISFIHRIIPVIDFRLTPDKIYEIIPDGWLAGTHKSQTILNLEYEWDLKKTVRETFLDYKTRKWL